MSEAPMFTLERFQFLLHYNAHHTLVIPMCGIAKPVYSNQLWTSLYREVVSVQRSKSTQYKGAFGAGLYREVVSVKRSKSTHYKGAFGAGFYREVVSVQRSKSTASGTQVSGFYREVITSDLKDRFHCIPVGIKPFQPIRTASHSFQCILTAYKCLPPPTSPMLQKPD